MAKRILNMLKGISNRVKNNNRPQKNDVSSRTTSQKIMQDFTNNYHLAEYFKRNIDSNININELMQLYGKRLENESYFYNLPLLTKLSKEQTTELAKDFFKTLDPKLYKKAEDILDCKNNEYIFVFEKEGNKYENSNNNDNVEILDYIRKVRKPDPEQFDIFKPKENGEHRRYTCISIPEKGDLRDLYCIVHEITHTFDKDDKDTETREIFSEVAPHCTERMLDEFLLNLSDEYIKTYGINREMLKQDIKDRKISTFLQRYYSINSLNNKNERTLKDLKYTLGLLYSSSFMNLSSKTRINELTKFIDNIKENNMNACSKSFGINLNNKLNVQFKIDQLVQNILRICNQLPEQGNLKKTRRKNKEKIR